MLNKLIPLRNNNGHSDAIVQVSGDEYYQTRQAANQNATIMEKALEGAALICSTLSRPSITNTHVK